MTRAWLGGPCCIRSRLPLLIMHALRAVDATDAAGSAMFPRVIHGASRGRGGHAGSFRRLLLPRVRVRGALTCSAARHQAALTARNQCSASTLPRPARPCRHARVCARRELYAPVPPVMPARRPRPSRDPPECASSASPRQQRCMRPKPHSRRHIRRSPQIPRPPLARCTPGSRSPTPSRRVPMKACRAPLRCAVVCWK